MFDDLNDRHHELLWLPIGAVHDVRFLTHVEQHT